LIIQVYLFSFYWFYLRDIKQKICIKKVFIFIFSCFSFFQFFISVGSWILQVQIWISWFVLVDIGILIYRPTGLNLLQIRIPICTSRILDSTGFQLKKLYCNIYTCIWNFHAICMVILICFYSALKLWCPLWKIKGYAATAWYDCNNQVDKVFLRNQLIPCTLQSAIKFN